MKTRSFYTDLCLKQVFGSPTLSRNTPRRSTMNRARF